MRRLLILATMLCVTVFTSTVFAQTPVSDANNPDNDIRSFGRTFTDVQDILTNEFDSPQSITGLAFGA